MKYALIIVFIVLAIVSLWNIFFPRVDASFATKGYVRFHHGDKHIDAVVSDDDLKVLKKILVGRSYKDDPSCGFGVDVSIRLTDGRQSVTFCPACDSCPKIRIGNSNRYISISKAQRDQLDAILARYGMVFPCV